MSNKLRRKLPVLLISGLAILAILLIFGSRSQNTNSNDRVLGASTQATQGVQGPQGARGATGLAGLTEFKVFLVRLELQVPQVKLVRKAPKEFRVHRATQV